MRNESGLGDLFRGADKTQRFAERAGRPRNQHPQTFAAQNRRKQKRH